jgi:hypothetical protein
MLPWGILAGSSVAAGSFEQIATTLVTSDTTAVTFSSIPGTYKHLQIRMTSRTNEGGATSSDSGLIEFNGDTTNGNYAGHYIQGSGSVNVGTNSFKIGSLRTLATSLNTGSAFAAHIIDIPDYVVTTKNKTARIFSGQLNTTYSAISMAMTSHLWINTAAITSISLKPASGASWTSGSRFTLYGIKGA